jgi:hypothetical protein
MPAQERIGLDNDQCVFPLPYSGRKHEEPEAIAAIQLGPLDLALQNAKLMTQQGILGNEICFGVNEVCQSTAYESCGVGTKECAEDWLKPIGESLKEPEKRGN